MTSNGLMVVVVAVVVVVVVVVGKVVVVGGCGSLGHLASSFPGISQHIFSSVSTSAQ